jgi:LysR family transcriptional regulator, transcriptional activator of the cysJI operon
MNFESLDPTALKAFYHSAQELNFTNAARRAAMTQSGVSQHIAKLEEDLGIQLFLRIGRQVRLTEAGTELLSFSKSYFDQVEILKSKLQSAEVSLKGVVRYAMPDSCLYTPHFQMLLEKRNAKFPNLQLEIDICPSEKVAAGVLDGKYDFGFVTRAQPHRSLTTKLFARETYVLAVRKNSKQSVPQTVGDLENRRWLNYPGMDVLFDEWKTNYFSKSKSKLPVLRELDVGVYIESLRGARMACQTDDLAGIFPYHCVEYLLREQKLKVLARPKSNPSECPIFVIELKDRIPSRRVQTIIDSFWEMKKS